MAIRVTLEQLMAAAASLIEANAAVAKAEKELSKLKERARVISEETIPNAMLELGMKKFTLTTGQVMGIKEDVYTAMTENNKPEAHKWLNDNKFGGLIKVNVNVGFSRGEAEQALQLLEELKGREFTVDYDESVHAQTLKAFLREQLSKGADIPLDLFGARPVWTTKISKT